MINPNKTLIIIMYEDLRKQAVENLKKEKATKKGVHIVGAIFVAVSIILFTVSLNFDPFVAYWIKFPILVLALVYGIIYFSVFGIPFLGESDELTDEEIGREIVKIYKKEESNNPNFSEDNEGLELKELEALKGKWEDDEEYV